MQTPVTLCSGELWSILVVRLVHSADLRSQLRHLSSAPSVACRSWVVTHPGTNPAQWCLTSVICQEPVCHRRLAVDKKKSEVTKDSGRGYMQPKTVAICKLTLVAYKQLLRKHC